MKSSQIGLVTFKEEVLNTSVPFSAVNKNVRILDGKWNEYKMEEFCCFVREWEVQELYACIINVKKGNNGNPKIQKEIHDIKFSTLKAIALSNNNI